MSGKIDDVDDDNNNDNANNVFQSKRTILNAQ